MMVPLLLKESNINDYHPNWLKIDDLLYHRQFDIFFYKQFLKVIRDFINTEYHLAYTIQQINQHEIVYIGNTFYPNHLIVDDLKV
jgi:hypothetical protein